MDDKICTVEMNPSVVAINLSDGTKEVFDYTNDKWRRRVAKYRREGWTIKANVARGDEDKDGK